MDDDDQFQLILPEVPDNKIQPPKWEQDNESGSNKVSLQVSAPITVQPQAPQPAPQPQQAQVPQQQEPQQAQKMPQAPQQVASKLPASGQQVKPQEPQQVPQQGQQVPQQQGTDPITMLRSIDEGWIKPGFQYRREVLSFLNDISDPTFTSNSDKLMLRCDDFTKKITGMESNFGDVWSRDSEEQFKTATEYADFLKNIVVNGYQSVATPEYNAWQEAKASKDINRLIDTAGIERQKTVVTDIGYDIQANALGVHSVPHNQSAVVDKTDAEIHAEIAEYDMKMRSQFFVGLHQALAYDFDDDDEKAIRAAVNNKNGLPEEYAGYMYGLARYDKDKAMRVLALINASREKRQSVVGDSVIAFKDGVKRLGIFNSDYGWGKFLEEYAVQHVIDSMILDDDQESHPMDIATDAMDVIEDDEHRKAYLMIDEALSESQLGKYGWLKQGIIDSVSTIPYMAMSALPYAGFVMNTFGQFENVKDRIIEEGGDPREGVGVQLGMAVLWSYIEKAQLKGITGQPLKNFQKKIVLAKLMKNLNFKKLGMHALKGEMNLVLDTLKESSQEGFQQIIEDGTVKIVKGDLEGALNGSFDSFAKAFVDSLPSMAILSHVGGTVRGSLDLHEAKNYKPLGEYYTVLTRAKNIAKNTTQKTGTGGVRMQNIAEQFQHWNTLYDLSKGDRRSMVKTLRSEGMTNSEAHQAVDFIELRHGIIDEVKKIEDPNEQRAALQNLHYLDVMSMSGADQNKGGSVYDKVETLKKINPEITTEEIEVEVEDDSVASEEEKGKEGTPATGEDAEKSAESAADTDVGTTPEAGEKESETPEAPETPEGTTTGSDVKAEPPTPAEATDGKTVEGGEKEEDKEPSESTVEPSEGGEAKTAEGGEKPAEEPPRMKKVKALKVHIPMVDSKGNKVDKTYVIMERNTVPNIDTMSFAQSVQDAMKDSSDPITAEEFMKKTHDQKVLYMKKNGLRERGNFQVLDEKGKEVFGSDALVNIVRVESDLTAKGGNWSLTHEHGHSVVAFGRGLGLFGDESANDPTVKLFRKVFGEPTGTNELFNEENFSNDFADYIHGTLDLSKYEEQDREQVTGVFAKLWNMIKKLVSMVTGRKESEEPKSAPELGQIKNDIFDAMKKGDLSPLMGKYTQEEVDQAVEQYKQERAEAKKKMEAEADELAKAKAEEKAAEPEKAEEPTEPEAGEEPEAPEAGAEPEKPAEPEKRSSVTFAGGVREDLEKAFGTREVEKAHSPTTSNDSNPYRIAGSPSAGIVASMNDAIANDPMAIDLSRLRWDEPRHSVYRDSEGRDLSDDQIEYFKDSKVRDEEGNLIPVYHSTGEDFTVFDRDKLGVNTLGNASSPFMASTAFSGFWFNTQNLTKKPYSGYSEEWGDVGMEVYLNITNPYKVGSLSDLESDIEESFMDKYSEDEEAMNNLEMSNNGDEDLKEKIAREASDIYVNKLIENGYDGIEVNDEEMGGTSYVAFDSNQAKKVDNLNPTQHPDIRYSVVLGEKGSQNLYGKTKILENLKVAKDMLNGRNWKDLTNAEKYSIRWATDWQQGIDGKWRLEREDPDYGDVRKKFNSIKDDISQRLISDNPDFKNIDKGLKDANYFIYKFEDDFYSSELNEWFNERWKEMGGAKTEEEREQFVNYAIDKFKEKYGKNPTKHQIENMPFSQKQLLKQLNTSKSIQKYMSSFSIPLNMLIDKKSDIFKAYKDANKIRVHFVDFKDTNQYGEYRNSEKAIYLSNNLIDSNIASTLKHEIQHFVQHQEGFAVGGLPSMFKDHALSQRAKSTVDAFIKIFDSYNPVDRFKYFIEEFDWIKMMNENNDPENVEKWNRLQSAAKENGYKNADDAMASIKNDYNNNTAYNQYHRLAGEVEARNAAKRTNDRLVNTLLEETEDEGRDVQIIKTDIRQSLDKIRHSIGTEDALEENLMNLSMTNEGKRLGWNPDSMKNLISKTRKMIFRLDSQLRGDPNYEAWRLTTPTMRVDWRDGQEKETVSWERGNIEYKYDLSADTLCINNEGMEACLFDPTMADIMVHIAQYSTEKYGEEGGYTSHDYQRLYETLRDLGFVVPCKGCFDFSMRDRMLPSVAQKFADLVNETIDRRNKDPEAFDQSIRDWAKEHNKKTDINGFPLKVDNKEMAVAVGVAGDKLTKHFGWSQLMSAKGQTQALADYGGIFRAWQRTGAGRPKDKLMPEPYSGVITSTQFTIIGQLDKKTSSFRERDVNVGTGLRRNSHSEFRPVLVIDEIQFLRDAFVKKLFVFKYMKELDDVRLFGKMGVKYNMSAFPAFKEGCTAAGLDENGHYIMSEESVGGKEFEYIGEDGKKHYDGMKGLKEAKKYINEDCSISSVVFSIPHLIKCFTDVPTPNDKRGIWGSLIPFHNTGSTAWMLKRQGLGDERAYTKDFATEAITDYDKGVTNFEQVQNDRFGDGWEVLEGNNKGQKVEKGHKLEFVNGHHYYNRELGVHLHSSYYTLDSENNAEKHALNIDYNDNVRTLASDYGYKEASDYHIKTLRKLGLIPRFDFVVPEKIFKQMCKDAHVDPHHPKIGWKGKGHDWSPCDSDAYYSVLCDYGMTDPKTGKWAPHRPVGRINPKTGKREFKLPRNRRKIILNGLKRYTNRRMYEDEHIRDANAEYCRRTIADGQADKKFIKDLLTRDGYNEHQIAVAMGEEIGTIRNSVRRMEDRVSGDDLENARDLIDDVGGVGAEVDENGYITVYHRSTPENIERIKKTGFMKAKEDGLFFSTKEDGQNAGYGEAILKLKIPAEKLQLDDIFEDEAHLRLPLVGNRRSADVSQYIPWDEPRHSISPIYSGSGNAFDEPSMVKVGSGTGQNLYGFGLYGSDSYSVAEYYAGKNVYDMFSDRNQMTFNGTPMKEVKGDVGRTLLKISDELRSNGGDLGATISYIQGMDESNRDIMRKMLDKLNGSLTKMIGEGASDEDIYDTKKKITTVEGKLKAVETELASIGEIKKGKLDLGEVKREQVNTPAVMQQTWWTHRKEGDESHLIDYDQPVSAVNMERINAGLSKRHMDEIDSGTGEEVYRRLSVLLGSEKNASEFLNDNDIDGVKYIGGRDGEVNYVSFSDKNLRVDHRYDYDPKQKEFVKRYSVDRDGNQLSEEQVEFFKDSKIRDENGRLIPMYHGTNQGDFNVFDWDKTQRADGGWYGRGHYFTPYRGGAESYGERIIPAYLNIRNPFYYKEELEYYNGEKPSNVATENVFFMINMANKFPELVKDKTFTVVERGGNVKELKWSEIEPDLRKFMEEDRTFRIEQIGDDRFEWFHGNWKDLYGYWQTQEYYGSREEAERNMTNAAIQYLFASGGRYSHVETFMPHEHTMDMGSEFSEALKKRGFDGVAQSRNGDEYVAFESNQIKRTDNRNPTVNPDIRHTVSRGDPIRDPMDVMTGFVASKMLSGNPTTDDEIMNNLRSLGVPVTDDMPNTIKRNARDIAEERKAMAEHNVIEKNIGLLDDLTQSASAKRVMSMIDDAIMQGTHITDPVVGNVVAKAVQKRMAREMSAAKGFTSQEMLAELPISLEDGLLSVADYEKRVKKDSPEDKKLKNDAEAKDEETPPDLEGDDVEIEYRDPTAEERQYYDELMNRAKARTERDEAERKKRKEEKSRKEKSEKEEKEGKTLTTEEDDDLDAPEEDTLPEDTVRRIAPIFESPKLFASFIIEWAMDHIMKKHPELKTGEELWKSPIAIKELMQTAQHILKDLARKTLGPGNPLRATVEAQIGELANVNSFGIAKARISNVYRILHDRALTTSRRKLIKELIDKGNKLAKDGRLMNEKKEFSKRKTLPEVEAWWRKVKKAIRMSSDAVNEAIQKYTDIINRHNSEDDKNGYDKTNDEEYVNAQDWVVVLNMYGAMNKWLPGQIIEASNEIVEQLTGAREKFEEERKRRMEADAEIRNALIDAVEAGGELAVNAEAGLFDKLSDSIIGNLQLRLEDMISYCKDPEKRAKALEAIQEIMYIVSRASERATIIEAQANQELNAGLQAAYGDADKGIKHLNEPIPEEVAKQIFHQRKRGSPPTYGHLLQLYSECIQSDYSENVKKHGRDKQIELMKRTLTPQDMMFHSFAVSWFRQNRKELSDANKEVTGMAIRSPDPMYTPVRVLNEKTGFSGNFRAWSPIPSTLSKRVRHGLDFNEDAHFLQILQEQAKTRADVIAKAMAGIRLREILAHHDTQAAVRKNCQPGTIEKINEQVVDSLMGIDSGSDPITNVINVGRSWLARFYLAYNLKSPMSQLASIPVWANVIGFRNTMKYMLDVDHDAMRELYESDGYKARYIAGWSEETMNILRHPPKSKIGKGINKFYDVGMIPLQKFDEIASMRIGQGLYRSLKAAFLDKGMSEEQAKQKASTIVWSYVEQTQQSGRAEFMNRWQRRKPALAGLVFQFMTSPLLQLNYELQAIREVSRGTPGAKARLARALVINHVIVPGLMHLINSAYGWMLGDPPDNDDEGLPNWAKDLIVEMIMGQSAPLFLLYSIGEDLFGKLVGSKPRYQSTGSLPIEGITKVYSDGFRLAIDTAKYGTQHLDAFDFEEVTGEDMLEDLWRFGSDVFSPARMYRRYRRNNKDD